MSNPNQSNRFGSTSTTFDENDQATIVQQLAPELESLVNQQFGFLDQGPAQLGDFSNPHLQSMMQGAGDAMARRGGYAGGDASQQGGYNSQMPQFGANPMDQANLPAVSPSPAGPISGPIPQSPMGPVGHLEQQKGDPMASLAEALAQRVKKPTDYQIGG